MAKIDDLRWRYRVYLRKYRYRHLAWDSFPARKKPLSESRVALVTSAAFHLPHQAPFDESIPAGDPGIRVIPHDAPLQELLIAHRSDSFDPSGIEADKNLALPLDRLRELEGEGVIGSIAARHYSFMGSQIEPEPFLESGAAQLVAALVEDQVDVALLTPI